MSVVAANHPRGVTELPAPARQYQHHDDRDDGEDQPDQRPQPEPTAAGPSDQPGGEGEERIAQDQDDDQKNGDHDDKYSRLLTRRPT